jgi:hypothetical protein
LDHLVAAVESALMPKLASFLTSLLAGTNSRDNVCINTVTDFELIDASVRPPIITDLTEVVDLLDFPTCQLSVQAIVTSEPEGCNRGEVECVKFFLDGVEAKKERNAPYSLYGNAASSGSFSTEKPPIGTVTLKACTYTNRQCTLGEQGCKTVDVTFLDCDRPTAAPVKACEAENQILGFDLVDAFKPKAPIITPFIPPTIDLLNFPKCELSILAVGKNNTCGNPPIKCVKMSLGTHVKKERFAPYSLYGNRGVVVRDEKPDLGPNTLRACTYTDKQCREGEQGCLEVDVYVKDCIPTSMT